MMETRIKMGDVVCREEQRQCRGGTRLRTYSMLLDQVYLDLDKNTPERILAEASDMEKNAIAGEISSYLGVENYTALYLVGPHSGYPVKIGISDDPRLRVAVIQSSHYEDIVVHAILWAAGGNAFGIEQAVIKSARQSGLSERGEWLSVTPATVMDMIMEQAIAQKVDLMTSAMAIENRGRIMRAMDVADAQEKRDDAS